MGLQLIAPEEMINPNVDELSIMTYLSQYPNAKLQKKVQPEQNSIPPPLPVTPVIRAYGPGLESRTITVGDETEFYVEASDGSEGHLVVNVRDSPGRTVPYKSGFDQNRRRWVVKYTPESEGRHAVCQIFF